MERFEGATETETRQIGANLAKRLKRGDVVFLWGELGAGKTTLVRGLLEALGHDKSVRSPTFNLIQTFDTHPPVMHADLYRLKGYEGLGLEDYLDTHLCLIEWPDRAEGLTNDAWHVHIEFTQDGRTITITPPHASR